MPEWWLIVFIAGQSPVSLGPVSDRGACEFTAAQIEGTFKNKAACVASMEPKDIERLSPDEAEKLRGKLIK